MGIALRFIILLEALLDQPVSIRFDPEHVVGVVRRVGMQLGFQIDERVRVRMSPRRVPDVRVDDVIVFAQQVPVRCFDQLPPSSQNRFDTD